MPPPGDDGHLTSTRVPQALADYQAYVQQLQGQLANLQKKRELLLARASAHTAQQALRDALPSDSDRTVAKLIQDTLKPFTGRDRRPHHVRNFLTQFRQYSPYMRLDTAAQVVAMSALLADDAAAWFQSLPPIATYAEFEQIFTHRWGDPLEEENARRALAKLEQKGSVKRYTEKFWHLTQLIPDLSETDKYYTYYTYKRGLSETLQLCTAARFKSLLFTTSGSYTTGMVTRSQVRKKNCELGVAGLPELLGRVGEGTELRSETSAIYARRGRAGQDVIRVGLCSPADAVASTRLWSPRGAPYARAVACGAVPGGVVWLARGGIIPLVGARAVLSPPPLPARHRPPWLPPWRRATVGAKAVPQHKRDLRVMKISSFAEAVSTAEELDQIDRQRQRATPTSASAPSHPTGTPTTVTELLNTSLTESPQETGETECLVVSRNAITSSIAPYSHTLESPLMIRPRKVNNRNATVLLDCGSAGNLLHSRFANGLTSTPTKTCLRFADGPASGPTSRPGSFFVFPSETLAALAICTDLETEIAEFHTKGQAQNPLELEPPQGTLVERLGHKLAGMLDQLRQHYKALLLRFPGVMPDKLPAISNLSSTAEHEITLTSDTEPKPLLIYHQSKAE
ncbi:MAG: hypothetical protein BJ554DRAFT_1875, partial [Olpidium bornovanus]